MMATATPAGRHPTAPRSVAARLLLMLALALTVLTTLAPGLATAEQRGLPAADEKAIRGYVADGKTLERLQAIKAGTDQLSDDERGEGDPRDIPQSIDGLVARIEKSPKAVALIRKAGMTPRDYVIATIALLRAGLLVKMDATSPDQIDQGGSNAANIAFYRKNAPAIDTLFAAAADEPDPEDDGADADADADGDDAPAGTRAPKSTR